MDLKCVNTSTGMHLSMDHSSLGYNDSNIHSAFIVSGTAKMFPSIT